METIDIILDFGDFAPFTILIYFIVYKKTRFKWLYDQFLKKDYELAIIALLLLGTPALTASVMPEGTESIEKLANIIGISISVFLFCTYLSKVAERIHKKFQIAEAGGNANQSIEEQPIQPPRD